MDTPLSGKEANVGLSDSNSGLGLVERLRDGNRYAPNHWSVMVEAANVIERLQRDNAQLQYALEQSETLHEGRERQDCQMRTVG